MNAGEPSRRVLIVEDEAITALDLSCELTRIGYDVCGIVDTSADAIAAARQQRPSLVLMDIRLADGDDGVETARAIHGILDTAIVFLTAQSDEATLARALDVSPFGYLIKPFRARDLKVTLDLALTKHAQDVSAKRVLRAQAGTDTLTGLANRRHLDEAIESEWARCARERQPLSVLMIDVDHFKSFNDVHGHLQGDACLRNVAAAIRGACERPGDVMGRWGGEEFLAVLPGTDLHGAHTVADTIVRTVREIAFPAGERNGHDRVTVSVGVASVVPAAGERPTDLVDRADSALYAAKHNGRDRVVAAACGTS